MLSTFNISASPAVFSITKVSSGFIFIVVFVCISISSSLTSIILLLESILISPVASAVIDFIVILSDAVKSNIDVCNATISSVIFTTFGVVALSSFRLIINSFNGCISISFIRDVIFSEPRLVVFTLNNGLPVSSLFVI